MLYQVLHGAGQTGTEKINSGMGKPGPQAKFHTTVYIRYSDCALATYK